MKRRSVLAGLGASVAGSALLFGSGAFTQVEADRNLSIGVDEDSDALLALEAGTSVASVYEDSNTGELVVDTRELSNNDEGFGVGSTVQIGRTKTDFGNEVFANLGDAAFRLTNNFDNVPGDDDDNDELDIAINLEGLDDTESDIEFIVSHYDSSSTLQDNYTVSGGSQLTINDVAAGDELYFAIRIETASTSNPSDIDGDVTFRAGPNLADQFPTDAVASSDPVVNATQDTAYGDIPTALNNANSGDLIQVDPSYTENGSITVGTDGVRIESAADSVDNTTNRPTIKPNTDNGDDNVAVEINAAGVTLDGLDVTFATQDGTSEKYGVRARNPPDPLNLTVQNCSIQGITTRDVSGNDGAVRSTGVSIEVSSGSSTSGVEVVNCLFDSITNTGSLDHTESTAGKDDDSRAKGVALNNNISDAQVVDNDFQNIGDEEVGQSDTAETVDKNGNGEGTEKARGITLTEDSNGDGPTGFEIARNNFENIEGTFGQPALFVGGSNGLGTHTVEQNNFYHPVDNLSDDTLDLPRNWWDGGNPDPSTEPSDQDEDGGILIGRSGLGASVSYNVNFSRSNTISDAGSSLSL